MSQVTTTIKIRKQRLTNEQRQTAKALLLETFPDLMSGGQLILHVGPGRNVIFIECQERTDHIAPQQFQKSA